MTHTLRTCSRGWATGTRAELFRRLLESALQELIDAELTATIGARPHERTDQRTNWRNGSRPRTLSTPAGKQLGDLLERPSGNRGAPLLGQQQHQPAGINLPNGKRLVLGDRCQLLAFAHRPADSSPHRPGTQDRLPCWTPDGSEPSAEASAQRTAWGPRSTGSGCSVGVALMPDRIQR